MGQYVIHVSLTSRVQFWRLVTLIRCSSTWGLITCMNEINITENG